MFDRLEQQSEDRDKTLSGANETKWSQNGAKTGFLRGFKQGRQKERASEVLVSEALICIAGTGFEPVTFGL